MSVTITVESGMSVKIVSDNPSRGVSLMELMARNKVTDSMLTTEVKSMLLDIMAVERSLTLDEFIAQVEAKTANLSRALTETVKSQVRTVNPKKPSYTRSPQQRSAQSEAMRRYHERRRAEKTAARPGVGEGVP